MIRTRLTKVKALNGDIIDFLLFDSMLLSITICAKMCCQDHTCQLPFTYKGLSAVAWSVN